MYRWSNISQPQNSPTLEQIIAQLRDGISRTHSNAEYSALSSFDKLVDQLKAFAVQINEKNTEIIRLQQLCKKNSIEYAPKKLEEKPIIPPPTIKKK